MGQILVGRSQILQHPEHMRCCEVKDCQTPIASENQTPILVGSSPKLGGPCMVPRNIRRRAII